MASLKVHEVVRPRLSADARPFLDPEENFELREIPGEHSLALLDDPKVMIFSVDTRRNRIAFVESEDLVSLSAAPFFHIRQRNSAKRLFVLELDVFLRAAEELPDASVRLLHVYSNGRCGSTLFHHALNQVRGVLSLSEPEPFGKLGFWKAAGRIAEKDEISYAVRVARASLRFLAKKVPPSYEVLAIKHVSPGITAFRELREAAPGARSVFLYRNPVDTIASFDRLPGRGELRRQWLFETPLLASAFRFWARRHWREKVNSKANQAYTKGDPFELVVDCGYAGFPLLEWVAVMDSYLALREAEPGIAAVRYEDLVADPAGTLALLLPACGLPADDLTRVTAVFAKDSQEGTYLDRAKLGGKVRLGSRTVRSIHAALRERTRLPSNLVLPGTVRK